MKDKNKKVTVIIISILIVLILLLALTYAYFSTQLNGTDNIVKVGELELVLDETSEGISLDNAVGISDSKGMSLEGSTFELINNGNNAVDYTIYLDDNTIEDTDVRIDDKYLKYNLNKNRTDSGATLLTKIGANPNRVLDSGTIEGKTTNKYKLNLWITDEVDGNYSGQVFSGKLRVEVSQERKTVSETLLASIPDENLYDDGVDTFITGEEPNNYVWYSGKLWRAVSINNEEKTVKLVTQWDISTIPYDDNSSSFEGSYMEEWLNDTSVDGFLGNLRNPKAFIKMDSKWNASQMSDTSKPPSESEGGTIIEDAVGLLNIYEYVTSYKGINYSDGYLNNTLYWWTITANNSSTNYRISYTGSIETFGVTNGNGIRPSINLKPEIKIVSGSGTEDNPYRLMGDNDNNLKGVYLKDRYSGEYISFGIGENNLYRIVSHETEGLTKITSAKPLRENGSYKSMTWGEDSTYLGSNVVNFLNSEYLNSGVYLTNEEVNMVEDNTTWYLGNDKNNAEIANSKVGLLRPRELMAGQFDERINNGNYFILTLNGQLRVNDIEGWCKNNTVDAKVAAPLIKPSMNLKSNVIITGGDGTKNNPFTLELP